MKPIRADDLNEDKVKTRCSTEDKSCGCSNGMCPGVILMGLFLAGWGLFALGSWIWGLII